MRNNNRLEKGLGRMKGEGGREMEEKRGKNERGGKRGVRRASSSSYVC